MSGWSLAAAAALGGLTVGIGQDAKPLVTVQSETAPRIALAKADAGQERVSVTFSQASVREVLEWLSRSGVSYVAADSEIGRDTTISLSVKDQPIEDVVAAIGQALGGHWERRGNVRVFRKGLGFRFAPEIGRADALTAPPPPRRPLERGRNLVPFEREGARIWRFDGPEGKKMREEMERLRREMPKMRIELERSQKDRARTEADAGRIRVEVEEHVRKSMEDARNAIERARKENPEGFDGRRFHITPRPRDGQRFDYRVAPRPRTRVVRPGERARAYHPEETIVAGRRGMESGLEEIRRSLTPEQREKHRRQGYLRAGDLSPRQLRLLGMRSRDGEWTIRYSKDNEEIVIKSD